MQGKTTVLERMATCSWNASETLEEAKTRMRKELKKTDLKYIYTHDASLRECWVMD